MDDHEDAIRLSNTADAEPNLSEAGESEDLRCEPITDGGLETAEAIAGEAPAVGEESLTGYALVADLMRRQDDVIAQIDQLDRRILGMIEEITAAREAEKAAELALLEEENGAIALADQVEEDAGASLSADSTKAAQATRAA